MESISNEEEKFEFVIHQPTMQYGYIELKGMADIKNIAYIQKQIEVMYPQLISPKSFNEAVAEAVDEIPGVKVVDPVTQQPINIKSSEVPNCAFCNKGVWDNRTNKKNPKAPDYKCKDKNCGGAAWVKADGGLNWKK